MTNLKTLHNPTEQHACPECSGIRAFRGLLYNALLGGVTAFAIAVALLLLIFVARMLLNPASFF